MAGEVGQQSSPAASHWRAGGRVQGKEGVFSTEPLGEKPALSPERAVHLPAASKQITCVSSLGVLPTRVVCGHLTEVGTGDPFQP